MEKRTVVLLLLITFFSSLILSVAFANLGSNWMKRRLEALEFKVKHIEESRLKNIEEQMVWLSRASLELPRRTSEKKNV